MNAALGLLLALPPSSTLVFALLDRLRGVVVSNALVPSVQEQVVRDIVFGDVVLDLLECPVGQRVDLDESRFVHLDDVQVTALTSLASSPARQDGVDLKFAVGTLGGFDLCEPVVELVVGLPKTLAVLFCEFGFGFGALGLVDVDVEQGVALPDAVHKVESLWEVVERVEEDEINELGSGDVEFREHVDGDQAGQSEGCCLEQTG